MGARRASLILALVARVLVASGTFAWRMTVDRAPCTIGCIKPQPTPPRAHPLLAEGL